VEQRDVTAGGHDGNPRKVRAVRLELHQTGLGLAPAQYADDDAFNDHR
jgi:hypothetical protein